MLPDNAIKVTDLENHRVLYFVPFIPGVMKVRVRFDIWHRIESKTGWAWTEETSSPAIGFKFSNASPAEEILYIDIVQGIVKGEIGGHARKRLIRAILWSCLSDANFKEWCTCEIPKLVEGI